MRGGGTGIDGGVASRPGTGMLDVAVRVGSSMVRMAGGVRRDRLLCPHVRVATRPRLRCVSPSLCVCVASVERPLKIFFRLSLGCHTVVVSGALMWRVPSVFWGRGGGVGEGLR